MHDDWLFLCVCVLNIYIKIIIVVIIKIKFLFLNKKNNVQGFLSVHSITPSNHRQTCFGRTT